MKTSIVENSLPEISQLPQLYWRPQIKLSDYNLIITHKLGANLQPMSLHVNNIMGKNR